MLICTVFRLNNLVTSIIKCNARMSQSDQDWRRDDHSSSRMGDWRSFWGDREKFNYVLGRLVSKKTENHWNSAREQRKLTNHILLHFDYLSHWRKRKLLHESLLKKMDARVHQIDSNMLPSKSNVTVMSHSYMLFYSCFDFLILYFAFLLLSQDICTRTNSVHPVSFMIHH